MSFEQNLQQGLFTPNPEKTYIDKLLARKEVERTKELIKKTELEREEILELLHMCSSTESKLLNLGEYDRYVILKFFVWIREFVKVAEQMFDMEEDLNIQEEQGKITLSGRSKQILKNNKRLIGHNTKFLVELYFNIQRTTLSIGATGFLELLKNKFEMAYPFANPFSQPVAPEQNKKFIWSGGKKNGA